MIQPSLRRQISHVTQGLLIRSLREGMFAKVITAKVGPVFRRDNCSLDLKSQAGKYIGGKKVKSNSKPNRSFSGKMALIQAV